MVDVLNAFLVLLTFVALSLAWAWVNGLLGLSVAKRRANRDSATFIEGVTGSPPRAGEQDVPVGYLVYGLARFSSSEAVVRIGNDFVALKRRHDKAWMRIVKIELGSSFFAYGACCAFVCDRRAKHVVRIRYEDLGRFDPVETILGASNVKR